MNLCRSAAGLALAASLLALPNFVAEPPAAMAASTSAPQIQNIGTINVLVHRKDKKGKKVLAVNAPVVLMNAQNQVLLTYWTNNAGRVSFNQLPVDMKKGSKYYLTASWEGKLATANTTLTSKIPTRNINMYIVQ